MGMQLHARDGRSFALKWTRGVTEGEELERILLEIQVQRQLQHGNVLPLEAAEVRRSQGHAEKEALMLFPLASRGSLQTLLEQTASRGTAAFTESECLQFFAKLVDAVAALHALGFAHRDLKPGNILLSDVEPMEPLLMDFGSVAPLRIQLKGAVDMIDGRADVWSLGCVLYAMAFGPFSPFEHPRDGVQHLAIVNGYVGFPRGNIHGGQVFSATFTALIKWILTPDLAERPKLEGVRLCINQLLNPAPRKQPSEKMKRLSSRKDRLSVYKDPVDDDQDWADFSAFEPRSMSSELSFSAAVRSRSSSAVPKPLLATRSSRTKRSSVSSVNDGSASAGNSNRDRGLSDPNRRHALSRTGKQMWVKALEAQMSD
ncbi:Protein kinase-like domain [Phytophthora cactorum]|nr:Protein kinase-like domain [Phytophthora cactorum]